MYGVFMKDTQETVSCLEPVTEQKQNMFVNEERLGRNRERKHLLPPKVTLPHK